MWELQQYVVRLSGSIVDSLFHATRLGAMGLQILNCRLVLQPSGFIRSVASPPPVLCLVLSGTGLSGQQVCLTESTCVGDTLCPELLSFQVWRWLQVLLKAVLFQPPIVRIVSLSPAWPNFFSVY